MTDKLTPTLVYDGECGFCRYWVDYWQRLTGRAIDYRAFQTAADDFPQVAREDFAASIHLFEPDGRISRGAEASFRVLASVPGNGAWLWLYRHVPGFAPLAEAGYRGVARHRATAATVSRLLWGARREPATCDAVVALFLRLLGFIYLSAFVSFGVQAPGLVGHAGVLPLHEYAAAAQAHFGTGLYLALPSLAWLWPTSLCAQILCGVGAAAGGALACGLQSRALLGLAWFMYLSVFHAGQDFMHFQWDLLLLEAGFLAIFLPGAPTAVIWLFRLQLARFLFLAGIAKLLSGDPTWWGLHALDHHFETQPLPTPLAWYAHTLPARVREAGTAATLVFELVLPCLLFTPRRPRMAVAACVAFFQGLILLTGNYNFFNLLTLALCVLACDDQALRGVVPFAWTDRTRRPRALPVGIQPALTLVIVTLASIQGYEQLARAPAPAALHALYAAASPFHLVNGYGLFANMTTRRAEIVIEGSDDQRDWRAYEFRYKPGDPGRAPGWNIPHQPRLDWQMWFAALGSAERNPWFGNLLVRLLQGSPDVLGLLAANPFPAQPPRFVRARLYDYAFAAPAFRWAHGAWWQRRETGLYFPAVSLRAR